MAQKILQIIPAPTDTVSAWNDKGELYLSKPACLALVEKGANQSVVFLELVDNEIVEVDTEAKNFLGFVSRRDLKEINRLEDSLRENGKPE